MSLTTAATAYIVIWLLLLNHAWVAQKPLLTRLLKDGYPARFAIWALRLLILLAIGFWLDANYTLRPHSAWQSFNFYLTFTLLSATFSLPGFWWFYHFKK